MRTQAALAGTSVPFLVLGLLSACHAEPAEIDDPGGGGLGGSRVEVTPSSASGGTPPRTSPEATLPETTSPEGTSLGGAGLGGATSGETDLGGASSTNSSCPDGTFSDEGGTVCTPHTLCDWDEIKVAAGTPVADTVCAAGSEYRQFGSIGSDGAEDVAMAPDGGVYVVGHLVAPLVATPTSFLRRFDAQGRVLWERHFGANSPDHAHRVAVGPGGRVVVLSVDQEDWSTETLGTHLLEFDAAGNKLWDLMVTPSANNHATSLALDASGAIFVAGRTSESLDSNHEGGWDAFVHKFDRAGSFVWGRQIGTTEDDLPSAVAIAPDGSVRVVGSTAGALGGSSHGGRDAFVWALGEDGQDLWLDQFGTAEDDWATAAVVGPQAGYVTGGTAGNLAGNGNGNSDVFVREFDHVGVELGRVQLESELPIEGVGLALDGENLQVLAQQTGPSEVAGAQTDAVLLTYSEQVLAPPWLTFGGEENDYPAGIVADEGGHVFVVGQTYSDLQRPNLGDSDAFVARFDLPEP